MRYPCRILTYSHIPAKRVYSAISASATLWRRTDWWYSYEQWPGIAYLILYVYVYSEDNYALGEQTLADDIGFRNTYIDVSKKSRDYPKKEHLNVRVDGYPKYWEKHP